MPLFGGKKKPIEDRAVRSWLVGPQDVPPDIRKLVERILNEAGTTHEPHVREEYLFQVADRFNKLLQHRYLEKVRPDKQAGFQALLDRGASAEELNEYLERYLTGPDTEVVFQTYEYIRDQYV